MADVWSHGPNVTTMHPIGGRQVGWDEVKASWENVAEISSEGDVHLEAQNIQVVGDIAFEVGVEHVSMMLAEKPIRSEIRVTNIYRREDETWKIIHHHSDPDPAMQKVLSQAAVT